MVIPLADLDEDEFKLEEVYQPTQNQLLTANRTFGYD